MNRDSGQKIHTMLDAKYPGIADGISFTTISTKFGLLGIDETNLFTSGLKEGDFKETVSHVVPSSTSHKRWVAHLSSPLQKLKLFRGSASHSRHE